MPLQSGRMKRAEVVFSRPNNSTAYNAGDVIDRDVGAGLTFENAFRGGGIANYVAGGLIIQGANQAAKLQAELWLFRKALGTYPNDSAPFAPSEAEMETFAGVVQFVNPFVGNPAAGASGSVVLTPAADNFPLPLVANEANEAADLNLYGVLVARNAYSPVNLERFQVILYLDQN